jgi:hypothetical protein
MPWTSDAKPTYLARNTYKNSITSEECCPTRGSTNILKGAQKVADTSWTFGLGMKDGLICIGKRLLKNIAIQG